MPDVKTQRVVKFFERGVEVMQTGLPMIHGDPILIVWRGKYYLNSAATPDFYHWIEPAFVWESEKAAGA